MGDGMLSQWRRGIVARGLAAAALLAVPVGVAAAIGFNGSLGGLYDGLDAVVSGPEGSPSDQATAATADLDRPAGGAAASSGAADAGAGGTADGDGVLPAAGGVGVAATGCAVVVCGRAPLPRWDIASESTIGSEIDTVVPVPTRESTSR